MKKLFTIVIAVVILASGLKVSINHHYCGGKLAATKITFSGKLASCGMESVQRDHSKQISIGKKCCEDHITYYGINTKYLPEYFKLSSPQPEKSLNSLPVNELIYTSPYPLYTYLYVLPPGEDLVAGVTLSEICVFRI